MAIGTLVQVTLPSSTNLPADDIVNTFAFSTAGDHFSDAELLQLMDEFYNLAEAGHDTVASYLSSALTRDRQVIAKAYDLADPEPRVPYSTVDFNLASSSSPDPLPLEVAVCLSYRAHGTSGEPAGRRRGRIFIGPLNQDALDSEDVDVPEPSSGLATALIDAGVRLFAGSDGTWSVWSRADDFLYVLNECSFDNEFDTQRRRGRRATFRYVQPL